MNQDLFTSIVCCDFLNIKEREKEMDGGREPMTTFIDLYLVGLTCEIPSTGKLSSIYDLLTAVELNRVYTQ